MLLAESHALYRDSLRSFFAVSGLEVVAVAARAQEAIRAAREVHPSIAVLDLHLEAIGGVETTRRLSEEMPDLPILLLVPVRLDDEVLEGIRCGASGYVFKGDDPDVMMRTIVAAARGEPIVPPELARFLLHELTPLCAPDGDRDSRATLDRDEWRWLRRAEAAVTGGMPAGAGAMGRTALAKMHRRHREARSQSKPDVR